MAAPLVIAALISAGTQLLMNRNQPAGQFQPASFNRVPAPTFQPPPVQQPGGDLSSLVMEAFLRGQTGLGAINRGNVGSTIGRTSLSNFEPARVPDFNPTRF